MPTKKTTPASLCDLLRANAKKATDDEYGKKLVKVQRFEEFLDFVKASVPETVEVIPVLGYSNATGVPPAELRVDTMPNAAEARVLIADISKALPTWVMATVCGCDTTGAYGDTRGQVVGNFVSSADDSRMEVKVRYAE